MNRLYPNHIFLVDNNKQFSNVDGTNYSAQINQVTAIINGKQTLLNTANTNLATEKGKLIGLKNSLAYDQSYYKQYADANNWSAAIFHRDRMNNQTIPAIANSEGLIDGYETEIKNLQNEIESLGKQKAELLEAQIAETKEKLANANLTPAQRLALEKQKADLERLSKESDSKAKIKKYLVIGGAILGGLAIIGYIIYVIKKRKKSGV